MIIRSPAQRPPMAAAGTWPVGRHFPVRSPALVPSRSPSSVRSVPQSCRGTWGGCLRVMQVPAHSITARRLPRIFVRTGGGNPSPGRVRRLPVVVPPPQGFWAEDVGEQPRRGRAWRSRVDETISGLAVGHCCYAQPTASVVPALSAPPSRTAHTIFRSGCSWFRFFIVILHGCPFSR